MTSAASIEFKITSWDEKSYEEVGDGRKLTRAKVTKIFSQDLIGEGSLEYLMAYAHDSYAYFVGMERITGRLADRVGTLILQHVGTFEGGVSTGNLTVVPGSATGELEGLRGEGGFSLGHSEVFNFELRYNLP
jgi:hypothetical protein